MHNVPERLLRFLAANSMVTEIGENEFAPSNITKTLTIPGLKAGINHKYVNAERALLTRVAPFCRVRRR